MKKLLTILFAVALGLNLSAQEECMNPDVNCDGFVNVNDLLGLLGYFGDEDLDGDGIWDSQDDCVLDICDVCNGDGVDVDGDGICDEWDDCVGELDDCGVCNGNGPEVLAVDTITFTTDSVFIEALNDWYVFEIPDTTFNFVCTNPGCMDPLAENYNPYASEDDGSCEFLNGEPACNYESSLNFNGYEYELIAIGEQCWFVENLRTELYANGDTISANLSDGQWGDTNIGAVAVYGEDDGCNHFSPDGDACDPEWSLGEYGRLYNWYAVIDSRGLCPNGWHVPGNEEWISLVDHFGGAVNWEEINTTYGWYNNGNGTNSTGFSALPGGAREGGPSHLAGWFAFWWSSSTGEDPNYPAGPWPVAWLSSWGSGSLSNFFTYPNFGYSVRCLRDE